MANVAVVGTAAADVVLRVPAVPQRGEHVSGSSLGWRLGGGSANVAVALAADGHHVELIGPFSTDDMGQALLSELGSRGVGTSRSFRVAAPSPRALILLDAGGERTIVGVDEAFSKDVYPLTELPALQSLGGLDAVYVETYHRFPPAIVRAGPDTVLVTSPPSGNERPWPADILVGSEHDYPVTWQAAPYEHARNVAGPRLQWVIVTRGARGADAYGPSGRVHVDAVPMDQVDATGAGDAFAAGLLSAVLAGEPIEEALDHGARRAASAVASLESIAPAMTEALGITWPGR